jgi:hypothetical protein
MLPLPHYLRRNLFAPISQIKLYLRKTMFVNLEALESGLYNFYNLLRSGLAILIQFGLYLPPLNVSS